MQTFPTSYRTTEAYISGGICGAGWWPVGVLMGKPFRANLRGAWGVMDRFTEPATFCDALLSLLASDGGDFQDARFTADTSITVIRTRHDGPCAYTVHVFTRELTELKGCADLVNADVYTADVMGDNE